ncbi:MAG: 23S rRNA (pseudouridine(1915)-N(3))-methyltransferase RlmH [Betaproteobacteria bacterium]|nr:MAG: 23S rRNA (pseudouridine(1915)-N(3))-methyltransferase RlmH [Betaproteobacteria bacterium]
MKLHVVSVGHKAPDWISSGFQEYTRRMPRELPVVLTEIRPAARPSKNAAQINRARATEADRILAAVPSDGVKVALDERGKTITTAELAGRLEDWMSDGRDVCFLIGGADGLDGAVRDRADFVLSLSRLTMPHALVRVVLAEQLYRAISIIRKHPYHRD